MDLLKRLKLMTIKEHHQIMQSAVDKMNLAINQEMARRTMLVDETINAINRWQIDINELEHDPQNVRVTLEVPPSILMGLARADPEISGFAIHRITHLLQAEIQKAINAVVVQRSLNQSFGGPIGETYP